MLPFARLRDAAGYCLRKFGVPEGGFTAVSWREPVDIEGKPLGSDGDIKQYAKLPSNVRAAGGRSLEAAMAQSNAEFDLDYEVDGEYHDADDDYEPTEGKESGETDSMSTDSSSAADQPGDARQVIELQREVSAAVARAEAAQAEATATAAERDALREELVQRTAQLDKANSDLGEARSEADFAGNQLQQIAGEPELLPEGPAAKRRRLEALDMVKLVNKPSTFDGTGTLRDWLIEMDNYTQTVCWDPSQRLGVASQFLRGEAMKWWDLKKRQLHAQGKPLPSTWNEFQSILTVRYDSRNPELIARNRLEDLQQGDRSVHQFLKEFEACYAHIPEYLEKDKVHKFLRKLQPRWRRAFQVNPATNQLWESFDSMVAYITLFVADSSTAITLETNAVRGETQGAFPRPPRRGGRNPRLSSSSVQQQQQRGGDRRQQQRGGRNARHAQPKHLRGKTRTNAAGQSFYRNDHLASYLIGNQHCLCCFETDGHKFDTCTRAPARGVPEGYEAPA